MAAILKKIWGITWRSLLFISAIILIIFAIFLWRNYIRYRGMYHIEEKLSGNVELRYKYASRDYNVYNNQTGRYTVKGVKWVSDAAHGDSIAVFCRNGKRGYFNVNTGEVVIPEQYDKAWVFSEGMAAVYKNGKIGFINMQNQQVLPFNYEYSYRNGMPIDYLYKGGLCTMTDSSGACGLIDKSGKWVMEAKYDCIWTLHEDKYRIVKDGDKYGMLDEKLEFIFPIEYDYIAYANDKGVFLCRDGYKWQADYDGTVIQPFVCDGTYNVSYQKGYDTEGGEVYEMSSYCIYTVYGMCGVMRKDNGKIIIPAIYEQINMLSPTLFEAQLKDEDEWVFLDLNGKTIKR